MILQLARTTDIATMNVYFENRHKENLLTLKQHGLQVVDMEKHEYNSEKKSQCMNEYLCHRNGWNFIVRDLTFIDDKEGVLSLSSIQNTKTNEVHEVYVDIRGKNTPIQRLTYLFEALDKGTTAYVKETFQSLLQLKDNPYVIEDKFTEEAYRLSGYLKMQKGENQLFITSIEDDNGKRLVAISNDINWRSPLQNRTNTKGYLLSLEDTNREELTETIESFFNELDKPFLNSTIFADAYRQAYYL